VPHGWPSFSQDRVGPPRRCPAPPRSNKHADQIGVHAPRSRPVDTMARVRAFVWAGKIPGVSTRMICRVVLDDDGRGSAPRVVCTLARDDGVTLEPTSALTSVDLPTLGAPDQRDERPQRVGTGAASAGIVIRHFHGLHGRDHRGCPRPSRPRACCRRRPSAGASPGKSTAMRNCGS